MKKLLIASCAAATLGCGTQTAVAGDIGLAGATYDWSGGYVGINTGAAFNSTQFKSDYIYTGSAELAEEDLNLINELDSSSNAGGAAFEAGVVAGYNMQMSSFVLGVEGDFNYLGFEGSVKKNVSDTMEEVMASTDVSAVEKIDYQGNWYGTMRARVGYAKDSFLVYGTGGLAYGQLSLKQSLDANTDLDSASWNSEREAWKLGWTLGGGIEYAVDRWTLGLEYLYVDLGTYTWDSMGKVNLADATADADWSEVKNKGEADYKFSVARATMKYRF
jgi:outer membrane immunogenic protein